MESAKTAKVDLLDEQELLEIQQQYQIGLIGFGDMGRLYAKHFVQSGWKVCACDIPEKYEDNLKIATNLGVVYLKDGHAVSRRSDFILYSVEASNIERVVQLYAPSTKLGSSVCGQTSVKSPEIDAFLKHMDDDVHIMACHSLHGPKVSSKDQPLVIVRERIGDKQYKIALTILSSLKSRFVFLSANEHDIITADTQVATHLAFLSMGTTWKTQHFFPWENRSYVGGLENVKQLMTLRIYASKWHVYAGLALLNSKARPQIRQYAKSVSELFKLIIQQRNDEFRSRVFAARAAIFKDRKNTTGLLPDSDLEEFSLSAIPQNERKPNSHLSLLAVVDCWHQLGLQPYRHLSLCRTPPFRALLGITEHLFVAPGVLDSAIDAALNVTEIRADDCEFYTCTSGWVECIEHGHIDSYRRRFEDTQSFFKPRLQAAMDRSSQFLDLLSSKPLPNDNDSDN